MTSSAILRHTYNLGFSLLFRLCSFIFFGSAQSPPFIVSDLEQSSNFSNKDLSISTLQVKWLYGKSILLQCISIEILDVDWVCKGKRGHVAPQWKNRYSNFEGVCYVMSDYHHVVQYLCPLLDEILNAINPHIYIVVW